MRIDRETGAAVVVLAVSLFFLAHLARAPAAEAGFVTTTTLPTAVAAVLTALSAVLLLGALMRPAEPTTLRRAGSSDRGAPWRVVAMVTGSALYVAAMPWLGYLASSALYIAGLAWLYGTRSWLAIAALAAVVPLVLMVFFERYMVVLLPTARLLH